MNRWPAPRAALGRAVLALVVAAGFAAGCGVAPGRWARDAAADSRPDAANDSAATTAGTPVVIAILVNDADADGDALTIAEVEKPVHGAASVNADGTVTYAPAAGFVGRDAFRYTVADPTGRTAKATVRVTVAGGDEPEPTEAPTLEPESTQAPAAEPTAEPTAPPERTAAATETMAATEAATLDPAPTASPEPSPTPEPPATELPPTDAAPVTAMATAAEVSAASPAAAAAEPALTLTVAGEAISFGQVSATGELDPTITGLSSQADERGAFYVLTGAVVVTVEAGVLWTGTCRAEEQSGTAPTVTIAGGQLEWRLAGTERWTPFVPGVADPACFPRPEVGTGTFVYDLRLRIEADDLPGTFRTVLVFEAVP